MKNEEIKLTKSVTLSNDLVSENVGLNGGILQQDLLV